MDGNTKRVRSCSQVVSTIQIPVGNRIGNECIQNDSEDTKSDFVWNITYVLIILILSTMFSYPMLLFPLHNSILFPQYWYEPIVIGTFAVILTLSLDTLIIIKYCLRADSMISLQVFIQLYFVTATFWVSINCLCNFVWTVAIGYHHPMPLSLILGYLVFIVHYTTLYLILRKDSTWDNNLSKRFKALLKIGFGATVLIFSIRA